MKMLTKEQKAEIYRKNMAKARNANPYCNKSLRPIDSLITNDINNTSTGIVSVNRSALALRGLRRYLRAYLDGIKSIKDFDKWRIKAPADALTFAHKVIYGDHVRASPGALM